MARLFRRLTANSSSSQFSINLRWTAPIALTIGVGTYYYIQHQLDQQPKKLTIDPHLPPPIKLQQPKQNYLTDPATQQQVPAQLDIASSEPLRLIGLGVRTVSFLAIKVYVAAFYADQRALRALRVVPGWADHVTKEKLLSHPPNNPDHQQDQNDIRGEALIRNLLAAPAHFAIRIAPVRPTDFTHLRDGFCRALTARLKLVSQSGTVSEPELEKASLSINTFRSFFPSGVSVPQGKSLTLIRTASQTLVVEYDGNKLGELDDPIVARELFLAYFADHDPISSKLKESVAEGFAGLYQDSVSS